MIWFLSTIALAVVVAGQAWFIHKRPTKITFLNRDYYYGYNLNDLARECHQASVAGGWWHDINTGEPLDRNHGELFMLMVTELAEGFEGIRKNLYDDKLPHRKMVEVEIGDAIIRMCDYAGAYNLDLEGAVREKMAFNAQREDHKPENRRKADGKKF